MLPPFVDFASAAHFFDKARAAHDAGNAIEYAACCKMIALAMGFEANPVPHDYDKGKFRSR